MYVCVFIYVFKFYVYNYPICTNKLRISLYVSGNSSRYYTGNNIIYSALAVVIL